MASDSGWTIHAGRQIEATASRLVGRSPHVLYTNVVEPILRWSFAERGYALVHAACLADRGRAFLLTARTDTGKTTTSLKILDSTEYSFLSDDLTLVTPQGRVLTYPKPLTISRHTLRAVKTPLLSRRERWGLVFQSRLHSRSGRRFAFVLAKTHLPAATINTIVQLLVPPPKFHVERLVPDVDVAVDARLAGMVVIERGGRGEAVLDEREALATLLSNCEDAYGFPPYSAIEGFLRSRNGMDLADREREIVAHALSGLPGDADTERLDGLGEPAARCGGRLERSHERPRRPRRPPGACARPRLEAARRPVHGCARSQMSCAHAT